MTAQQIVVFVVFPVVGYLLGSVPFAWVIGKTKGVDIRTVGSKNIGATNLGRMLGMKYFVIAFLLDAGKGFLPVLAVSLYVRHYNYVQYEPFMNAGPSMFEQLSSYVALEQLKLLPSWSPLITAAACFLGHLFPVWLKFKGGKGVATSFGVVMGYWPTYTISGLVGALIFVVVLMVYRYISLASICSSVGFLLVVSVLAGNALHGSNRIVVIGVAAFFAAMIMWRHRGNIGRLMKGTEPKWGQKTQ